jgi:hypothetical protein
MIHQRPLHHSIVNERYTTRGWAIPSSTGE